MTIQDTLPLVQPVRLVDKNGIPFTPSNTIHLVCHSDPSSGRNIILWDDILAAFKVDDVIHVRSGTIVLPFLKGADFKNLDPLRFAALPGITLDIVVRGYSNEKELSMAQLQETLPDVSQDSDTTSTASNPNATTTKPRRNPAFGLVEKAMDAYRDNENPAFGPKLRGPQAL
ncbi:hypothetical protein EC991_010816, partial [Linnemannia zychae]